MSLPASQTGFAIKGVPIVLIEDYAKKTLIARIEKAESADLKVSFPIDPIYGGNALYPHDYIDKDRTGTLEITTSRFQYGLAEASTGAKVTTGGSSVIMQVIGERAVVPSTTTYAVTLKNKTTVVADSLKVYYADTGVALSKDTTASVGKYSYAAGVLTFDVADKGKDLIIDYQYTAATADLIEVLTNGVIPVVKITLMNDFNNQDGVMTREVITVHKAKAGGDLEHSESRGNPSKHSLMFNLMDPERADNQLYTMSYEALAAPTAP